MSEKEKKEFTRGEKRQIHDIVYSQIEENIKLILERELKRKLEHYGWYEIEKILKREMGEMYWSRVKSILNQSKFEEFLKEEITKYLNKKISIDSNNFDNEFRRELQKAIICIIKRM